MKDDADLRALLERGQTIEAIRRWRERHGGSLPEAHAALEAMRLAQTQRPGPTHAASATRDLAPTDAALAAEIDQLLRAQQKILAIKRYREETGVGLREAKAAILARDAALKLRG